MASVSEKYLTRLCTPDQLRGHSRNKAVLPKRALGNHGTASISRMVSRQSQNFHQVRKNLTMMTKGHTETRDSSQREKRRIRHSRITSAQNLIMDPNPAACSRNINRGTLFDSVNFDASATIEQKTPQGGARTHQVCSPPRQRQQMVQKRNATLLLPKPAKVHYNLGKQTTEVSVCKLTPNRIQAAATSFQVMNSIKIKPNESLENGDSLNSIHSSEEDKEPSEVNLPFTNPISCRLSKLQDSVSEEEQSVESDFTEVGGIPKTPQRRKSHATQIKFHGAQVAAGKKIKEPQISTIRDSPVSLRLERNPFRLFPAFDTKPMDEARAELEKHKAGYIKHMASSKAVELDQMNEIREIRAYFQATEVPCFKYNHSLQQEVQSATRYKGFFKLSEDATELEIYTQKFNSFTLEYDIKKSSSSCCLDEVTNIIFGGQSSRFWMMRKYLNSKVKALPFYAWECLTLQTEKRDIDLVIQDPSHMEMLLKLLVYALETVDGARGSAKDLIKALIKQKEAEYLAKPRKNNKILTRRDLFREQAQVEVYGQALKRLRFLIMRSKISYSAFARGQTIPEMFYTEIMITLHLVKRAGLEHLDLDEDQRFESLFPNSKNKLKLEYNFLILQKFVEELRQPEELSPSPQFSPARTSPQFSKVLEASTNNLLYLRRLMNKNNVLDLFKDIQQKEYYEQTGHAGFLNLKWIKASRNIILQRIRLCLGLKLMGKALYLKTLLKRIEIHKELFNLMIAEGGPVRLHRDLQQDEFPSSFRYYDSILRIIDSGLAEEKKDYFRLKQGLLKKMNKSLPTHLAEALFGKQQSLIVTSTSAEDQLDQEFKFETCHHMQEVQRSNYLQINNNLDAAMPNNDAKIQVKFCTKAEVEKQEKDFLLFRSKFAMKLYHLKSLGKSQELTRRVQAFISSLRDHFNGTEKEWIQVEQKIQALASQIINDRKLRQRGKQLSKTQRILRSDGEMAPKNWKIDSHIENNLKNLEQIYDRDSRALNRLLTKVKKVNQVLEQQHQS